MAVEPKVDVEALRKRNAPAAGTENGLMEIQRDIKGRETPELSEGPKKTENDVFEPATYEKSRTFQTPEGRELGPFKMTRQDH